MSNDFVALPQVMKWINNLEDEFYPTMPSVVLLTSKNMLLHLSLSKTENKTPARNVI